MSLLIKGIDMPPDIEGAEVIIHIKPDGTVFDMRGVHLQAQAVELSTPHGRLKDEKWIKEYITDTIKGFEEMNRSDLQNYSLIAGLRTVEVMIEHAPTVIEAEE